MAPAEASCVAAWRAHTGRKKTMSMMSRLLKQCRKPTGWLGRFVARGMNISHSEMTDWGLAHISIGIGRKPPLSDEEG